MNLGEAALLLLRLGYDSPVIFSRKISRKPPKITIFDQRVSRFVLDPSPLF